MLFIASSAQALCQHLIVHFDWLQSCPPDINFPIKFPPTSPSTGDPSSKPSLHPPPGTTLEVVDNVDPTDCYSAAAAAVNAPISLSPVAAFSPRLLPSRFCLVPMQSRVGFALMQGAV